MNRIESINKENLWIKENEFKIIPHEEFNNLTILNTLGLYERIVSLLKELILIFNIKENYKLRIYNSSHGGYIPLKCSDLFSEINIINQNDEHNENIQKNLKEFNINNIVLNETNNDSADIIFIENYNYSDLNIYINSLILLCPDSFYFNDMNVKFNLTNTNYVLYINDSILDSFIREFHYFIKEDGISLDYDNLINYTMIIKNGGDELENILKNNLPFIDRWTILDTGSTDNTINIIKKVLGDTKKGNLYTEPFINFRDSRNRCLDLAGKICKFNLMLDDTYMLQGDLRKFLNTVRGDQFSDSFSMFIGSHDVSYCSNRIIKSESELRYIYRIHEVITPKNNKNVIVPRHHSYIYDFRCDYMENRTMSRKEYDLQILFQELKDDPNDPRALYYLGQTYNVLEKYDLAYKYYVDRVNHPTEGFIQEKIDACFEAARMANFKLNKSWEECEKLYLKSFELDNTRGDSLYFLGIHYFLLAEVHKIDVSKNHKIAYDYMKKCLELGYPEHCQYSLKPTLHYYFLPKFLAHLSYIFRDYKTGLYCSDLFLNSTKNGPGEIFKECYNHNDVKTMESWKSLFNVLLLRPSNIVKQKNTNKVPYFVFMQDGGFNSWTGKDILTKGMGGSETFTIEMARYLQKTGYFQVVVFCRCEENEIFEGVEYRNINEYFTFVHENDVHSCLIGRYSEYYPYTIDSNVQNIYLIAHDLDFTGNVIPIDTKLKRIFCLSEWHVEYYSKLYTDLKPFLSSFGYGIDIKMFNPIEKKIPYKFIYSSFPIRGLLPLLEMWPKILNRYPCATLHIHSDVDGWWSNKNRPEEMKKIKELLHKYNEIKPLKESLFYKGWTSKKELINNWKNSDICFYPCTYLETFCHTAMEAAISKTLIVTTDLGALKSTVGDRGILLDGDFYNLEFQDKALIELFKVMDNIELKNKLIEKNYNWASNLTWENRTRTLIDEHLKPTITHSPTQQFKNIDNRLKYANMFNWTNDLPEGKYKTFTDILNYVNWKNSNKQINVLEIGTYTGVSLIKILDFFPKYKATVIDAWKNYTEVNNKNKITYMDEIEENNIEKIFYENIKIAEIKNLTVIKNDSTTALFDLINNGEKFDFIYIDGSHMLLDSYTDILYSFILLDKGGIMAIDDYLFNTGDFNDKFDSPKLGVDKFLKDFSSKLKILNKAYRVFIEKL